MPKLFYILRYWESEVGLIKPLKNKIGQRLYKGSDIQLILMIKKLLYEDKYTMAGTKRAIKMAGSKKQRDSSNEILLNALNEQVASLRWILDFMRASSR